MNVRRLAFALLGAGMGLLFYFIYRDDHTLSNRLLLLLSGADKYFRLKWALRQWLPALPSVIRGCLPSALWCIIGSSLLGGWSVRFGKRRLLSLAWTLPLANACWEAVQWLGWTDGHGDWLDVLAGFLGWVLVQLVFFGSTHSSEEIRLHWNWRTGVVVVGFASMALADIWP